MVGREIKLKSIIASSFQEVFLLKYINVEESAKKGNMIVVMNYDLLKSFFLFNLTMLLGHLIKVFIIVLPGEGKVVFVYLAFLSHGRKSK